MRFSALFLLVLLGASCENNIVGKDDPLPSGNTPHTNQGTDTARTDAMENPVYNVDSAHYNQK